MPSARSAQVHCYHRPVFFLVSAQVSQKYTNEGAVLRVLKDGVEVEVQVVLQVSHQASAEGPAVAQDRFRGHFKLRQQ